MRRAMRLLSIGLGGLLASGCLEGWVSESAPTDADLHAVFGVEGGGVWAVGADGTVLVRSDSGWSQLDSGVEVDLHGVWGSGPEHVLAVGDECTALEFNGAPEPAADGGEEPPDLRPVEVEGCPDFVAVHGHDPADANAVGSGRIYWYDGQQLARGGWHTDNLLGIHVNSDSDRHMCGDDGLYRRHEGENWSRHHVEVCPVALVEGECPMETSRPILWDVWADEAGAGALVGNAGGLWRLPPPEEDAGWEALETHMSGDLRAVHGRSLDGGGTEIYVVGNSGVVLRLSGGEPKRQDVGTNQDLLGVWVAPGGGDVYAVGRAGTIVHLAR